MKNLSVFLRKGAPFMGAFCLLLSLPACSKSSESAVKNGSVGYEIFTGSFADSNADGTGDLTGIKNRLDYLEDLGVHRLWLTPIFPSPTYHKYDCTDYRSIDPSFGSLQDFDDLVASAHQKGMEIILDLVLNHTSSSHPWFLQSAQDFASNNTGADSKKDWYVWSTSEDAKTDSSYKYSSLAHAWYEARFDTSMPDLNLACPAVVTELKSIASYWLLDHKADGFRFDATTYYFYMETSKNVAFLKDFAAYCRSLKPAAYLVGECYNTSQKTINSYAASGINFFNFPTSQMVEAGGVGAAVGYDGDYARFFAKLPTIQSDLVALGVEPAYFITNHDMSRWGKYFAGTDITELHKVAVSLYLLTPGTPWMYYGEEIMMRGLKGDTTDAPQRTGMIWGGDVARCSNPQGYDDSGNQVSQGAFDALKDPESLINHYKKVLALRNRYNDVFEKGSYTDLALGMDYTGGFEIDYEGKSYYLLHNRDTKDISVTLAKKADIIENILVDGGKNVLADGTITLAPYSSAFLALS